MTAIPIDVEEIEKTFLKIKENCQKQIDKLYITKCPKCNREAKIVYTILKNENLIEIGYECEKCLQSSNTAKRFLIKKPDTFDNNLLKKTQKMSIPFWSPVDVKLSYNGSRFIKGEKNETVGDLYDKRAIISLSIIYNEIEKIKDEKIRNIFKIIFTSNVHNVSKSESVHQPRWKKGMHPSTSWIVHSFWVPPLRVECPVWFYFEERVGHIIKGKKDSNTQINHLKATMKFSDLKNNANILIKTYNALELTIFLKNQ